MTFLTKESQLYKNKPKKEKVPFGRRPSKGNFGKKRSALNKKSKKHLATPKERSYLTWFKKQKFSCIVCGSYETESHHIKEHSSDKKNHFELLPLCREHHTGKNLSPHGTSRLFKKYYPMEKQRKMSKKYYKQFKKEML